MVARTASRGYPDGRLARFPPPLASYLPRAQPVSPAGDHGNDRDQHIDNFPPQLHLALTAASAGSVGRDRATHRHLHRGDPPEVDRQLAPAIRARPSCTFAIPDVAVRAFKWPW